MLNRVTRKIGSWLGLFAILMATLAPTVSHTLEARADDQAMTQEHCQMASMDDMSSMADDPADTSDTSDTSHASQPPVASSDSANKHAQMSDGDACGYCSLLAHLPVMPALGTLFVAAVRAREHIVATRFESVRRAEPLAFAQPRAPPFAS
jgi:hypothetical protein